MICRRWTVPRRRSPGDRDPVSIRPRSPVHQRTRASESPADQWMPLQTLMRAHGRDRLTARTLTCALRSNVGRRTAKCELEHLVHRLHWMEANRVAYFLRQLFEITRVGVRDYHVHYVIPVRRDRLLLETTDQKHASAQRYLTRHGKIAAHRNACQRARDRRRDRDTGARSILRRCAVGDVNVDVSRAIEIRRDAELIGAAAHITHRCRC